MIRAITGLPGEGKTCFAVQHVILPELQSGNRRIYTNVEWNESELDEYCKSLGFEVDLTRLRSLTDDKISRFWDWVTDDSLIVLDEVAEHFNSQAWKRIGEVAGTWARQHRKLGHECYLVVQDMAHIYKQFRDLVAEEIKVTNLGNRTLLGIPFPSMFVSRFVWRDSKNVSRTKLYRFNTKVFTCYNTNATVGGVLERTETKKGKDTIRTKKPRHFKLGAFLSDHWFKCITISIVVGFCSVLFIIPQCAIKSESEGVATNETETIDTGFGIIPKPSSRTGTASQTYDVGRYDSPSKREP